MDPLGPFLNEVRARPRPPSPRWARRSRSRSRCPRPEKADFAVPCFPLAKALRKEPPLIAEEAVSKLPPTELIAKAWADKGYLNFKLDDLKLNTSTLSAIKEMRDGYGRGDESGKKVLLEHTSVNPTGPIHIGRARNPHHRRYAGPVHARLRLRCHHRVLRQ